MKFSKLSIQSLKNRIKRHEDTISKNHPPSQKKYLKGAIEKAKEELKKRGVEFEG